MKTLTLDVNKSLKEQVIDMVDWLQGNNVSEVVESTHQAYGIIAEKLAEAKNKTKGCDSDAMGMLKTIAAEPEQFIASVTSLYNSAVETAAIYLLIARDAKHIIGDMFDYAKTPIEQYADTLNDDFEETEDI